MIPPLAKTPWRVTFHPSSAAIIPQNVKKRLKLLLPWCSCIEAPCTPFLIRCNDSFLARLQDGCTWGILSPRMWEMLHTACLQKLCFTSLLEVPAVPGDSPPPWKMPHGCHAGRLVAQDTLFCFIVRCDHRVQSTERGLLWLISILPQPEAALC